MRRTIVVALGTAACGVALHFRRRRQTELRRLECAALRASSASRTTIDHRASELLGSVRVLAIDLDGTGAYRIPPALELQEDGEWGPERPSRSRYTRAK